MRICYFKRMNFERKNSHFPDGFSWKKFWPFCWLSRTFASPFHFSNWFGFPRTVQECLKLYISKTFCWLSVTLEHPVDLSNDPLEAYDIPLQNKRAWILHCSFVSLAKNQDKVVITLSMIWNNLIPINQSIAANFIRWFGWNQVDDFIQSKSWRIKLYTL